MKPSAGAFGDGVRRRDPPWAGLFALALVLGLLAIGAAFLFYDRYYRWEFKEEGRAYDSATHTVYVEQAGWIWSGCSLALATPAVALAFVALGRRRKSRRRDT